MTSHFARSKKGRGGRRSLPYAFTEHGALMLANVLKSKAAVHTSIQVVKAFIRLREMVAGHEKLAQKIQLMEKKYDSQFKVVFEAIRQLIEPPLTKKRQIGFNSKLK